MVFLSARWTNLIMASYRLDPARLALYLPPGCAPDMRDGSAWCSLVAFDFLKTRVLGIPWPGFTDFPEINLRFYVRCGGKRGVVFIREFVPQRFVALVARTLYNEPYWAAQMESKLVARGGALRVSHRWSFNGSCNRAEVVADREAFLPAADSAEHWFKEHRWGFGTDRLGQRLTYEVRHPHWQIHPVRSSRLDVDFQALYGAEWADLSERQPDSLILARGSAVTVGFC